ncbi:MAG: PEP-CTERM sorting domain-containing protein [Gemmataceae bacterium]|nr:PEP-CTERM sorting domain-containing protein [Gemmataceae bacterium]
MRCLLARPVALSLAALLLAGTAGPARGAFITFQFTGTVDFVDEALSGTFAVGDKLTGSYTFDSTTAARAGSNANFAVFDALTALNFSVSGYSAASAGAPEIQVDNDPPAPDVDRYAVVSRASDGLTGPPVNDLELNFFGFRLDDSTNTVFSDARILPTTLDLSDFDNRRFFIFFEDGGDNGTEATYVVSGTIDSLRQPAATPEPASLALVGVGAAGLAVRRLRRRA